MNFASRFLNQFQSLIVCVLSCFDRVIFKGYLPFHSVGALNSWVDHGLRIRRAVFIKQLEQRSQELVDHGKALAEKAGRPYEYRQSWFRKERLIQEIASRDNVTEGLIAVLCVQETCRTVKLAHGDKRPRLIFAKRPQRVLYYYFIDRSFGLMYVRLETWFPYTIQMYVNGHEWLARQMAKRRLSFAQHDNCFTKLDDPDEAQTRDERELDQNV